MGQKEMRYTLSTETPCGSVDMSRDESVLILLQHCRDMKHQEKRLRLITLLLLLSCVGLFIFTQLRDSGYSGRGSSAETSPAYSKQERACPADDPATVHPTTSQRMHIALSSRYDTNRTTQSCMKWEAVLGENYDEEKRAIVITEGGIYYVYMWMTLRCLSLNNSNKLEMVNVKVTKRNEGMDRDIEMMKVVDSVMCKEMYRTMFVGQLFELLSGDHVQVIVNNGYELILRSSFGAFLT